MILARTIALALIGFCLALFAQPTPPPVPMSVQLRQQAQATDWHPPRDVIYDELVTNTEPLVVRVTVSSNVIRKTLWWKDNVLRTNYAVLESNVVSVVTNQIVLP